jgi:hypothetical protein
VSDEPRPRTTGYFVEPDERSTPLLIALGHLVWGAAGLEKTLQLELARLHFERAVSAENPESYGLEKELAGLERLTGGQVRIKLSAFGLPADLDARISDAIDRRNALVHRPMEDVELVRAITSGEGMDVVVERVQRLALDCGELAVELELFARGKLEAMLGKSGAEVLEIVQSLDPSQIEDPRSRVQVEAVQAAGDLELPPAAPGDR